MILYEKIIVIKNRKNTAQYKSKYGSWINHWKKYTGNEPLVCSVKECPNTNLEGSHILIINSKDNNKYIVPLCHYHNEQSNELEIDTKINKLVQVNESEIINENDEIDEEIEDLDLINRTNLNIIIK